MGYEVTFYENTVEDATDYIKVGDKVYINSEAILNDLIIDVVHELYKTPGTVVEKTYEHDELAYIVKFLVSKGEDGIIYLYLNSNEINKEDDTIYRRSCVE